MVLDVHEDKTVTAVSPKHGLITVQGKTIILTMGCRERTRGASARRATVRPAYSLPAQRSAWSTWKATCRARRSSSSAAATSAHHGPPHVLEGCKVQAVLEICPFSNGLTRNMVQCLYDYDIPLYLSHTITAIHGKDRVTGITAAKVDDHMQPIPVRNSISTATRCSCLSASFRKTNCPAA